MTKITKIFFYIIFPFLSLFIFLLFLNILKLDWSYAHKIKSTYQEPFDWVSYKLKVKFLKTLNNFGNIDEGLTKNSLFISVKSQKNLLEEVPSSTKIWQKAFFVNNDVKEISIRHSGDNPANWLFEKKKWRIRTKRNELFDRHRYFEYIPFDLESYFSGNLATKIGILSPKLSLVELYINDESHGIYIKSERINENFLRRNKIMPVNIYKGEQILSEGIVGLDNDLFGSHGSWSKVALFNKVDSNNKNDLITFLNTLIKSENNSKYIKKLFNRIDFNQWVKFSAYQVITQNYHNDSSHNMRIISDPWLGKISPIVHDPVIGKSIFSNEMLNLEHSSHRLFLLLNKSSFFINKKYEQLIYLLSQKKIIENELDKLNELKDKILLSGSRDFHNLALSFKNIDWKKSIIEKNIFNDENLKKIFSINNKMINHKSNILKKLYSKPTGNWYPIKKGFSINVDGYLPLSNLNLNFKKQIPKWVAVDINKNSKIDKNEYFYPNNKGSFDIPLSFYANRISYAENTYKLLEPDIKTVNTRFDFFVENFSSPENIKFTNKFSKKLYNLKNNKNISVPPNKFNYPIFNDNQLNIDEIKFSGINNIKKNLIINKIAIIEPGTTFLLDNNKSIIFKNKVKANGTIENPIKFIQLTNSAWGTIALLGKNAAYSELNNVIINGGSGAIIDDIHYTSSLSLHGVNDVKITNLKISNNYNYDDAIHLVYCKNINFDNILVENAYSDALDIDISKNIDIKNSTFLNPNNDSIDLMESEVVIESTEIYGSGDKGISVGENSKVLIYNTYLKDNTIGLAVKDRSVANIIHVDFNNNKTHVSNYQKNYQYGAGGNTKIYKSNFISKNNLLSSDENSKIIIEDSSFNANLNTDNEQILLKQNNSFDGNKNSYTRLGNLPFFSSLKSIQIVKNVHLRGSDFLNN